MNLFIIGSDSFIAKIFIKKYSQEFNINAVSRQSTNIDREIVLKDFFEIPESCFQNIDVVVNFAAIVHKPKIRDKEVYNQVNHKLVIYNAQKAKDAGVKLFIQFSTVAVYGNQPSINIYTTPSPKTLYGISKLKADEVLISMQNEHFKIAILRPSMVYGDANAPGNMIRLVYLSNLRLPLPFKNIENKRDYIHVSNLVQYLAYIIKNQLHSIFLLTDQEPVSTKYLLQTISGFLNKKPVFIKFPAFLLDLLKRLKPDIYFKLFGSLEIDPNLTSSLILYKYSVKEGLNDMVKSFKIKKCK